MIIQPKNWSEFQHYKDRSPSWIKLHKKMLDDYEFHCLQIASKALAPLLWLLASEYIDGKINAPIEKIAFRLRVSTEVLKTAVNDLVSSGFFVMYQDASESLAELEQIDSLEREREKEEYKEETEKRRKEKEVVAPVKPSRPSAAKLSDEEWMEQIKNNPAYEGVDIDRELGKCQAWCITHRKIMSRGRIVNWLNKADKPVKGIRPLPSPKTFDQQRVDGTNDAIRNFLKRGEHDATTPTTQIC